VTGAGECVGAGSSCVTPATVKLPVSEAIVLAPKRLSKRHVQKRRDLMPMLLRHLGCMTLNAHYGGAERYRSKQTWATYQWCRLQVIHWVHLSAPGHEHSNNVKVALLAGPVQWRVPAMCNASAVVAWRTSVRCC
jgi:hypothetical protein